MGAIKDNSNKLDETR